MRAAWYERQGPANEVLIVGEVPSPSRVILRVIDQGTGMDAAFVRDELFQPFRSTKSGGYGIGAF